MANMNKMGLAIKSATLVGTATMMANSLAFAHDAIPYGVHDTYSCCEAKQGQRQPLPSFRENMDDLTQQTIRLGEDLKSMYFVIANSNTDYPKTKQDKEEVRESIASIRDSISEFRGMQEEIKKILNDQGYDENHRALFADYQLVLRSTVRNYERVNHILLQALNTPITFESDVDMHAIKAIAERMTEALNA